MFVCLRTGFVGKWLEHRMPISFVNIPLMCGWNYRRNLPIVRQVCEHHGFACIHSGDPFARENPPRRRSECGKPIEPPSFREFWAKRLKLPPIERGPPPKPSSPAPVAARDSQSSDA